GDLLEDRVHQADAHERDHAGERDGPHGPRLLEEGALLGGLRDGVVHEIPFSVLVLGLLTGLLTASTSRSTATAVATSSEVCVAASSSATRSPCRRRTRCSSARPSSVRVTTLPRASSGFGSLVAQPRSTSWDTAADIVGCEQRSSSASWLMPVG